MCVFVAVVFLFIFASILNDAMLKRICYQLTDRVAQVNSVCQRFATLAEEARDKVLAFAVQETCIRSQVNKSQPCVMSLKN